MTTDNPGYLDVFEFIRPAWHGEAACRGSNPDVFFGERGLNNGEAKAICRVCPVRKECIDHALERGEKFGVWGGFSERERRRMRRVRRSRQRTRQPA